MTKDASKMPYLANYPAIRDWLYEHEFRCLWQTSTDRKPLSATNTAVEMWAAPNGMVVIITVHPRGHGWDVFTTANDRNIAATLADAERRLGLGSLPGDTGTPE